MKHNFETIEEASARAAAEVAENAALEARRASLAKSGKTDEGIDRPFKKLGEALTVEIEADLSAGEKRFDHARQEVALPPKPVVCETTGDPHKCAAMRPVSSRCYLCMKSPKL